MELAGNILVIYTNQLDLSHVFEEPGGAEGKNSGACLSPFHRLWDLIVRRPTNQRALSSRQIYSQCVTYVMICAHAER